MAWNPALHPRGPNGRFTRSATKRTTVGERRRADAAFAAFTPVRPANRRDALARHAQAAPADLTPGQDTAVASYRTHAASINADLRQGKTDSPTVAELDSAMSPLTEDTLLTRRVGLDMFQGAPIDQLVGRKVKDAGYAPTSVVPAAPTPGPEVRMRIAAPAGTDALLLPDSRDGEVILPRDTELVVQSATPDGRGGWDMDLVVLPKAVLPKAADGGQRPAPAQEPAPDSPGPDLPDGVELVDGPFGGREVRRDGRPLGTVTTEDDGTFAALDTDSNIVSDGHPTAEAAARALVAPTPTGEPDTAASGRTPHTIEATQTAIVDAVAAVLGRRGRTRRDPLLLSDLRRELDDTLPRDLVDEALRELARSGRVILEPESNRKALTGEDKAAAVAFGRQDKHLISLT